MTAEAREAARAAAVERLMENGVVFEAPFSAVIDDGVSVARGVFIGAGVALRNGTVVGAGSRIEHGSVIDGCNVGQSCVINASQLFGSTLERGVTVGPYAYIRPGCHLGEGSRVGSFVELKNTRVGPRTNIPHLSYVGDADVGRHVNVGCGVITANFDGREKNKTTVGDDAFLGSNSVLVAPVKVGEGAVVAAGSVITGDVPPHALGIARGRQAVKEGWALGREKNW